MHAVISPCVLAHLFCNSLGLGFFDMSRWVHATTCNAEMHAEPRRAVDLDNADAIRRHIQSHHELSLGAKAKCGPTAA